MAVPIDIYDVYFREWIPGVYTMTEQEKLKKALSGRMISNVEYGNGLVTLHLLPLRGIQSEKVILHTGCSDIRIVRERAVTKLERTEEVVRGNY
jgi:hypothetical protein